MKKLLILFALLIPVMPSISMSTEVTESGPLTNILTFLNKEKVPMDSLIQSFSDLENPNCIVEEFKKQGWPTSGYDSDKYDGSILIWEDKTVVVSFNVRSIYGDTMNFRSIHCPLKAAPSK